MQKIRNYICTMCKHRYAEVLSPKTEVLTYKNEKKRILGPFCPTCFEIIDNFIKSPGDINTMVYNGALERVSRRAAGT